MNNLLTNDLTEKLQIKHPIIQAPMAGGVTTTELVTAVSLHGGLGMIGAGYMSPEQLLEQIQEVKEKTATFGVNLFVPQAVNVDEDKIQKTNEILQPIKDTLQVTDSDVTIATNEERKESFDEQLDVILNENVPVCSFTFGLPDKTVIEKLKAKGIITIGTATTVEEAIHIEQIGIDIVVVQGSEAGGHRGNFLANTEDSLIGLMSLIPQVVDHVGIPVIAAGGIMDGRGLIASLCLGAKAVQMGTAFMLTEESGTQEVHAQAILRAKEDETTLTRAFSGKYARGIRNEFMNRLRGYEENLPPFPIQNSLTQSIRKGASSKKNAEYMSLWCGQSPRLAKKQTVAKLIEQVVTEAEDLLKV